MTNTITINDKTYVLCDFKSPSFSLQQGLKLGELIHSIVQIPSLNETLQNIMILLMNGVTKIPYGPIIKAFLGAKDLFARPELPQIFFVLYLPEGTKYNEEYEKSLEQRARAGKYEIPLNALVEGLQSFFSSKTIVAENLIGGSTESPAPPPTT